MTWFRRGASPSTVAAQVAVVRRSDVRWALPGVVCPTLVINHADVDDGRYLAAHIAGARYIELVDPCHLLFSTELDAAMAVTNEMVNGTPVQPAGQRVLTTLLFTDIVGSTARVAAIGDRRWALELDHHDDMVGRQVRRFDGELIKTVGDGAIACFAAPSGAVRCALAIQHEAGARGTAVRAGVHTGEVERRGGDVLGLSVHLAQRICALATADQVLVSQQVVDLVAGSDLTFAHHGEHAVRGLGGRPVVVHAASMGAVGVRPGSIEGRLADLSPRELEVLGQLGRGASNADIAATLSMSEATAKAHVSHLFVKLGCSNRVQLAILAHDAGV